MAEKFEASIKVDMLEEAHKFIDQWAADKGGELIDLFEDFEIEDFTDDDETIEIVEDVVQNLRAKVFEILGIKEPE